MKAWQMFGVGVVALMAVLFLPVYESLLAGSGAFIVVGIVVFGFIHRPRKEVFCVHSRTPIRGVDESALEHDCVAVRVELARLWLLFVPTFLAVGFLVVTAAKGSTWHFRLIDHFLGDDYVFFYIFRVMLFLVVALLSAWLRERFVLRDADACSARKVFMRNSEVAYMFVDRKGEYYGGEGLPLNLVRPAQLGRLVLYNVSKPERNKIGMSLLFHRLVVIGRGVTDIDHDTVGLHQTATITA